VEPNLNFLRQRAVDLLRAADKAATFEERTRLRADAEHFAMLALRHEQTNERSGREP